jgi:phage baseplate assembly protein gpV
MSHGLLASWLEDLAMTGDERGYWPPYVGELWDASPEGSFESVPTVGRGIQISRVEG